MFNRFLSFRKKMVHDFDGGIYPPEMKNQSNRTPIRKIPLASQFIIPLKQQHNSIEEGEPCVKPGDQVLRGQQLTSSYGQILPIHAPTSGKITAISLHAVAHPSYLVERSFIIEADGKDRWIKRNGWRDYYTHSREELINRIHQFGIVGLGGSGFPTSIKLRNGTNKIHTLIINAAECEPYITTDDRLIQDCADQIIEGIRILAYIIRPDNVLIGIEDNKLQAISMLHAALTGSHDITLCIIPTKYPSGSAKQLIQILTGKQVPHGGHSLDIGVLVQNVSTAFAVKRAVIDGEPLIERVVTLTGEAIHKPGNIRVRLGTPVRYLLEQANFHPSANQMVIMGGPLMGFSLACLDVPIVKITNCLLAPSTKEIGKEKKEKNCIRCGACADVCPINLLPQQLYWYSRAKQHDKAIAYNISDCIECGACTWVCPSNIPLVQYFHQEKSEIYKISMEKKRITEAKTRFEARKIRLEKIKREKIAYSEYHKKQAILQFSKKEKDKSIKS